MNKTFLSYLLCAYCLIIADSLSASVFDFGDVVPVYDANRSVSAEGSGVHSFGYASADVSFKWTNGKYGSAESPVWMYSWEGINVSNCFDTTVDISKYYTAGEKAQYTSVNGSDASGVAGGNYGIFYGTVSYAQLGYSCSDFGKIVFDTKSEFSSVKISNTLVGYDYLTKTLDDNGDFHLQEVRIYGIRSHGETESDFETTDNYVTAILSNPSGVSNSWLDINLSALNTPGGLVGLYFKIYTDDFDPYYGSNSPSYFALDNIVYTAIPESGVTGFAISILTMVWCAIVCRRRI